MADSGSIAFACTCGRIRGTLSPVSPTAGTHLKCHCRDCRAAELYLGQPDPDPNGVDLFQSTSDRVHFDAGTDDLAILRLGPRGPLRWYAACCKAPLFITLARPGVPFATAVAARLDDISMIGPVRTHAFMPTPGGAAKHKGAARMVWRLVSLLGAARLSGRWRQTPFFDLATGLPIAPVQVLTKAERAALDT